MQNFLSSHKVLWLFAAIGIIAIGLAIWGARSVDKSPVTRTTPPPTPITITEIPSDKLPDRFPTNIPQEPGATVLSNNVQVTSDGRFQATRSYVTAKTLDENIKIYQTYLQSNGWTTTFSVNQPQLKSISATKDDLNIQVSVNDNQLSKQKTVTIYIVQKVTPK